MSCQFDRKNISHRTLKFNMKGASRVWEGCSLTPKRIVHIDGAGPQVVVASLAFFQLSPKQGGVILAFGPSCKEVCVMSAHICNSGSSPWTQLIPHSPPQTRQYCKGLGVIVIIWDNKRT